MVEAEDAVDAELLGLQGGRQRRVGLVAELRERDTDLHGSIRPVPVDVVDPVPR